MLNNNCMTKTTPEVNEWPSVHGSKRVVKWHEQTNQTTAKRRRRKERKKPNRLFFTSFAFSIIFLSIVTPVSRFLGLLSTTTAYCTLWLSLSFSAMLQINLLTPPPHNTPPDAEQRSQARGWKWKSIGCQSGWKNTRKPINSISNYFITIAEILYFDVSESNNSAKVLIL